MLGASVGSTDFHYLQKDYNSIITINSTNWSDTAWIGDELNSKIVIWTKALDIHNVIISSSDFTTASGNIIDASNITISWLKETLTNIGCRNFSAPSELYPDIIHKSGYLNIEAKKIASCWININIPRDSEPGIYNGTITLNANELETPYIFKYSFEVLNIIQPLVNDTTTQVELWQSPYSVARYYDITEDELFTDKHFNYLKSNLEEYRDMGGRGIIANIVEEAWNHQSYDSDPSMVKWTKKMDGDFKFDYTHFDKWIQFNIDLGIINPKYKLGQIKCYSIVPWNSVIQYFDESTSENQSINPSPGSSEWEYHWSVFLSDFINHIDEKSWLDVTYISMDERAMDELKASIDLIKSITNKEGKSFKISSAMNYKSGSDYSFLDRIDDLSIGLSHIDNNSDDMKNMSSHRKKLGLLTTIYTCTGDYPNSFSISDPSESAWTMWYSLSQNTDGFLRWSWDGWVENPLDNISYKYWEPGDPFYIYPAEKNNKDRTFYSTPRYERLKEGIRDINKAKYLIENSNELSNDINALIKSLKKPNKGDNGYGSTIAASESDRELINIEVKRMRNGISKFTKKYIKLNNI